MNAGVVGVAVALLSASAWAHEPKREAGCMVPKEFTQLWPDPDAVTFRATTLEEREAFTRLVPKLLAAARQSTEPPEELVALANQVGFRLDVWKAPKSTEVFWALRERAEDRRGAGAYVLRTGKAADVVLQSPHVHYDLGTDTLGAALFVCAPEQLRPRAFLTNTAHRFRSRAGERKEDVDHPADLAHNPDHLFQITTDALVREMPEARVIQLHGFAASEVKREKLLAVVSSGTRAPTPWTRRVALRLGEVLGEGVRLFPDQTERLGGTRNAQGRLVQAYPKAHFVHLELSAKVRKALDPDKDATAQERLSRLAEALFDPEEG